MSKRYTIKAGDTIQRIAIRECGDAKFADQIARDNNISNPNRIFVGQTLTLNCGAVTTPTTPTTPTIPTTPPPASTTEEIYPAPPELDPHNQPTNPSPQPGTTVRLNVPYYSQEVSGALWGANDCGPACVRMVLGWDYLRQGKTDPTNITVDTVTKASGIGPRGFSTPATLERVGRKYGLTMEIVTKTATVTRIKSELSAGYPVVCLLIYGRITGNQSKFTGGHFMVAVGYDTNNILMHDPLWSGTRVQEGAFRLIPNAQLEAAMQPGSPYFSIPNQAVFISR